jgi:ribosomal protein L9
LTKVVQIEFGCKPFFLFQKNKRIAITKAKITKARTARKTASKKQTERKAAEIKDKAKEDLDSERDCYEHARDQGTLGSVAGCRHK